MHDFIDDFSGGEVLVLHFLNGVHPRRLVFLLASIAAHFVSPLHNSTAELPTFTVR